MHNFLFNDNEIRIVFDEENNPWFVLSDVLKALESSTTVTAAKESINQGLGKVLVVDHPLKTRGGDQMMTCIAKPAITFLVDRSNTEIGKQLRKFIHLELLPEIEKTGQYKSKIDNSDKLQLTKNQEADIIDRIGEAIFSAISKIDEKYTQIVEENNKLKKYLEQIVLDNAEIKKNMKLLSGNPLRNTVAFYPSETVVEAINMDFVVHNELGIFTKAELWTFLKDIKMYKQSLEPFRSYVNANFTNNRLGFSLIGYHFICQKLMENNIISKKK